MNKLSFNEINFHDALLVDFGYDWNQQTVVMSITSFLEKDESAISLDLEFQGVTALLYTNLQPWGPSQFINLVVEGESPLFDLWPSQVGDKMLHIQIQSGDDVFVAYKTVVIRQTG
ncbi:MAG: hypothetical protein GY833_09690 [Aestuariibacter sp.]|nr:hypothetical protein [Aestuariibacter sp.]